MKLRLTMRCTCRPSRICHSRCCRSVRARYQAQVGIDIGRRPSAQDKLQRGRENGTQSILCSFRRTFLFGCRSALAQNRVWRVGADRQRCGSDAGIVDWLDCRSRSDHVGISHNSRIKRRLTNRCFRVPTCSTSSPKVICLLGYRSSPFVVLHHQGTIA